MQWGCGDPMTTGTSVPPVVLIAAAQQPLLASALKGNPYAAVVQVHTGTLALQWAPDLRPDTILLEADLPDMSGTAVCRLLHGDPRIGHDVPIVILAPDQPTPEQRVTALRAGAWDYLPYPTTPEDLSLKLQTYVQAKRNIDLALAGGMLDPTTGLYSRHALARRARELGALMARQHGALACVVFALQTEAPDPEAGGVVARTARVSDVVGALSATEFAVIAPGTNEAGAVQLAQRIADALCAAPGAGGGLPVSAVRVGYDAVENLTYSPIDPVELLARASAAVQSGIPEPRHQWVRRFDVATASGERGAMSRATPPGLALHDRKTSR
jgi:DNA-binding response OmpR family regulator